jgi:hypothetical protein
LKRVIYLLVVTLLVMGLVLTGCPPSNGEPELETITIKAIPGVTAPATAATPVASITATAEYTGIVSWVPAHDPFEAETPYTATIVLAAKEGYTFVGVPANFFTVSGATATNAADSDVVTAVFPATAPTPPPEPTFTIIRDDYGVPHVFRGHQRGRWALELAMPWLRTGSGRRMSCAEQPPDVLLSSGPGVLEARISCHSGHCGMDRMNCCRCMRTGTPVPATSTSRR